MCFLSLVEAGPRGRFAAHFTDDVDSPWTPRYEIWSPIVVLLELLYQCVPPTSLVIEIIFRIDVNECGRSGHLHDATISRGCKQSCVRTVKQGDELMATET